MQSCTSKTVTPEPVSPHQYLRGFMPKDQALADTPHRTLFADIHIRNKKTSRGSCHDTTWAFHSIFVPLQVVSNFHFRSFIIWIKLSARLLLTGTHRPYLESQERWTALWKTSEHVPSYDSSQRCRNHAKHSKKSVRVYIRHKPRDFVIEARETSSRMP